MSRLPRCHTCKERITFFGSPFTGNTRAFDPTPVDPRTYPGVAYPVMSGRAYRFLDLVEVTQVRLELSSDEAEQQVRDMPWHVLHQCTERSD